MFLNLDLFNVARCPQSYQTDVCKTSEGYKIICDAPGFKKDDLEITYQNDLLNIKSVIQKDEKIKYILNERGNNTIDKQFYLRNIDKDSITATLTDGILTINLKERKDIKTNITIM